MVGVTAPRVSATVIFAKSALQRVLDNLRAQGFDVIGPTVRDGAVMLDQLENISQLPVGWTLRLQPGTARLARSNSTDYFGVQLSANSWKRFLYPPQLNLFSAHRNGEGWIFEPIPDQSPPSAFIGVRSCDLAAIAAQDDVFLNGPTRDPHYARRRERVFIVAVNCTTAAPTCFCTSLNTGPRARSGFDLAITELPESFAVEIGSEAGSNMLDGVDWQPASAFDLGRVTQVTQRAEQQIQKHIDTSNLPQVLYDKLDHPTYWDSVGARCLSCANCTLSCPTCFCSTMTDHSDLKGMNTSRARVWDSCFTLEFSHLHGGNARPTVRSRYRQWFTHKLGAWIDQFGKSGCVGCGRCITWCPVGIDITEELRTVRGLGAR